MNEGSCKKPNRSSKFIFLTLSCSRGNAWIFTYILTLRNLVCSKRRSTQGSVTVLLIDHNSLHKNINALNYYYCKMFVVKVEIIQVLYFVKKDVLVYYRQEKNLKQSMFLLKMLIHLLWSYLTSCKKIFLLNFIYNLSVKKKS